MAKETKSISEIVESHKPKNFKFKFYFKDDEIIKQLESENYDMSSIDTIKNDDLTNKAYNETEFTNYTREILGKAKEPTTLSEDFEDGIIISKKMITKADKKLQNIGVGYYDFNNVTYLIIKLQYERFDILEIFIKI